MAKQPRGTHFVISAGLTTTGAPTYLTPDGSWSPDLQRALPISGESERDRLLSVAAEQEREISDPYAFAVLIEGRKIDPLSKREDIRATGPTVPYRRPDPS
jgi:hypothetical protein